MDNDFPQIKWWWPINESTKDVIRQGLFKKTSEMKPVDYLTPRTTAKSVLKDSRLLGADWGFRPATPEEIALHDKT